MVGGLRVSWDGELSGWGEKVGEMMGEKVGWGLR